MYYYKARIYSPTLGRFMQTDPIGYEDAFNLYGYVGNDPVNAVDPTGEECKASGGGGTITCTLAFDKKISEMLAKELAAAHKALSNYTMAAATAYVAAEMGLSVNVTQFAGQKGFSVPASQIRDELFKSPVSYYFDVPKGLNFAMQNTADRGIQINGPEVMNWSDSKMQSVFLHEGIHQTPAERAALSGRHFGDPGVYWGHGGPYGRAASSLMRIDEGIWSQHFRSRPPNGLQSSARRR